MIASMHFQSNCKFAQDEYNEVKLKKNVVPAHRRLQPFYLYLEDIHEPLSQIFH